MRHLLTVSSFALSDIIHLLARAEYMQDIVKTNGGSTRLKHKVMASIFYEPSTRTSCSFQAAMLRLGGSVINVNVEQSSIQKGETLEDTVQTMSCYSDVIVMRHPRKLAVAEAARVATKPLINAGDGVGEHPTQALLDLFTIQNELGRIGGDEPMTITVVGDLKNGRTVHSLVKLLVLFPGIRLLYISPNGLSMPKDILEYVDSFDIEQRQDVSLEEAIKTTDVLYVTRIQKERFDSLDEYEKVIGSYCINAELMSLAKKDMIVMHPLPRLNEISTDIDADPRAAYFRQMENGMYMRMAILENLLCDP
jgi:carbamoyl-phosphate synthase / aspartate carbamoyltransferase / dihydroorotase